MRERKEEGKNLWDDHAPFPPCVGPPGPLDDVSSRPDGADDGRLIEVGGVSPRRVERLAPRRGVRKDGSGAGSGRIPAGFGFAGFGFGF